MEITGEYRLGAPRDEAWELLLTPEALQRALPGCQQLTEEADGRFAVTLKVGVAAIKGTVTGNVHLLDQHQPDSYTMAVDGKGSIGVAAGKAVVHLQDAGGATIVRVAGEAEVHGLVASVGQRMLRGVAVRMMDQFFKSIDHQLSQRQQGARAGSLLPGDVQ